MNEPAPAVVAYLTREIRDLIGLGPLHALTWVSRADPGRWMQVSVHDGAEHYLTVICVLPPGIARQDVDRLVGKTGRWQAQANQGACLIYYLAQSSNVEELLGQVPEAAKQCAAIVQFLWNAIQVDQFALLGACGPRLPLPPGGDHAAVRWLEP